MAYEYDEELNQYRDTKTGRFVARATVMGYVASLVQAGQNAGEVLSGLVSSQQLALADFRRMLKQELKDTYIQQFILGRGGRSSMTQSDWGVVGNLLRREYRALERTFASVDGLSEGQINNRVRQYFKASRQAFERGNSRAYGTPDLPAYPGDGSTKCKSGCTCSWDIQRTDDGWDCYWRNQVGDDCPTCLDREGAWSPLRIRDNVIQPYRDIKAQACTCGELGCNGLHEI